MSSDAVVLSVVDRRAEEVFSYHFRGTARTRTSEVAVSRKFTLVLACTVRLCVRKRRDYSQAYCILALATASSAESDGGEKRLRWSFCGHQNFARRHIGRS